MGSRSALVSALLLASCAPSPPTTGPVPERVSTPAADPASPALRPVDDSSTRRRSSAPEPAVPDSLRRAARLAVDSVLDAAMLDRIAVARPPLGPVVRSPPGDLESATIASLFDIDVANFEDQGRVKYWVDFFTGPARERMAIWLTRMPRYEPVFRQALLARGLPGDLAFLPLIESGYSPTAVSRSRAVGMWQFMKATGRVYGLRVDGWVDERRDVSRATAAAVRYLGDFTARFTQPIMEAWLRKQFATNAGYDRIVRELLTAPGKRKTNYAAPAEGLYLTRVLYARSITERR